MKKRITIVITLFVVLLITSGCASQSGSEQGTEPTMVMGKISGGFTATVRELLPDYVLDDSTNTMAVVTEFQARPFIISVGKEMASKLEKGESYYFQVKERTVADILETEFTEGDMDTLFAINKYNLEITEFRVATDKEQGDNSPKIIMKKTE